MISRSVFLVPSFTTKEAFKKLAEFFNNMQVFHPLYSILYTVNFRLARLCQVFTDPVTLSAGWHMETSRSLKT